MELTQKQTVTILRILYPIWTLFGIFSIMYVPSVITVHDDALKTATNLLTHQFLFRSEIVVSLLTQLLFIFAVLFLYKLFETVHKTYSMLMVILALVSVPIAMLNSINMLAALQSIKNPDLMMLFLNINEQGIIITSIFWGLWLFPLGTLVYKSGYFPKIIGILLLIGGLGYTLSSFTKLLLPDLKPLISIFEAMTFGEVIFLVWLVIMGVKIKKV